MQDEVLKQHTDRLENAVNMACALQRNEETLLKDRIAAVSLDAHCERHNAAQITSISSFAHPSACTEPMLANFWIPITTNYAA